MRLSWLVNGNGLQWMAFVGFQLNVVYFEYIGYNPYLTTNNRIRVGPNGQYRHWPKPTGPSHYILHFCSSRWLENDTMRLVRPTCNPSNLWWPDVVHCPESSHFILFDFFSLLKPLVDLQTQNPNLPHVITQIFRIMISVKSFIWFHKPFLITYFYFNIIKLIT